MNSRDTTPAPPPARGPLGELVAYLGQQAPHREAGVEDPTLAWFRATWSRLSADRRMTQSLAAVPENAGPLNSHQLVHRALTLMRQSSPEYLHHFMAHVDALLWLEQADHAAGAAPGPETPRAEGRRKTSRSKSR
ncbi:MAG: DUF2894 domain-containing protein [Variovorax sp.]